MHLSSIKNLIFDLGGVILDLSVDHTLQSFSNLSGIPKQKVQEIFAGSAGFNEYEKGEMDDASFRGFIREIYTINASDEQIDTCWNAMLRGIPRPNLDLLEQLKKKYKVYLLSNTNGIHLDYINKQLLPRTAGENTLDSYFHKAYYSHRMLKRKPDAEIFEQVLHENSLLPGQTLFLDDNVMNVKGADAVGIKTVHVTTANFILEYFNG